MGILIMDEKIELIITNLKDSIGSKAPIEYFSNLTLLLEQLTNHILKQESQIEQLNSKLNNMKIQMALAVHWEPKIALNMIEDKIEILRKDKELYSNEISILKQAYAEGLVIKDYDSFSKFWLDNLGYHPFIEG
jgi:predicted RNase H-like nuclease (RuvC/YqgF family)